MKRHDDVSAVATDSRQDPPPALPGVQMRCFADHHPMVAHRPAWRCEAGPDVRRAVGVGLMGRTRGSYLTSIARPRQAASVRHLAGHLVAPRKEVKMILKEP